MSASAPSTTFKDHFSSHAAGYAAHRPTYPDALIDLLVGLAPAHDLALDCGCGSGQLSVPLAAHFARVVATDASASQIASAQAHPRITYRASPAERSGLADASADLITVAQAAHWLDLDAFYAEVRRVARPGALLALITYGVTRLEGAADPIVQRFYREDLDAYWPPERAHVEDGYSSLPFPFEEIAAPELAIELDWRLSDLVGYFDTWSAVRQMEKAIGRGPIERVHKALAEVWGDPQARHRIRWPIALRLGRV